ncbi:MAG: hypothetical protein ACTSX6_03500 [Candidatus Heimdallarchaeaceae archaeon]
MYVRYVGNNVDLDLLISAVKEFLLEKGFKISEKSEDKRRILHCRSFRVPKTIEIVVEGDPENFSIETSFVTERLASLIPYYLYYLFGGGYFLVREIKTREMLRSLEKDFKTFIEYTVSKLTNTKK